jgi:hypothetical protein
MISHPMLAAAYAEMGRQQDADGERAIVARLWPFLDAEPSPRNSARRKPVIICWKV